MSDLMQKIKDLRELTGAGFLDCKKALEENNNDIDDSIDYLRKKGLSKASKKSSREAKEGAIGIYMNEKYAVMLEIKSETDFAAKNDVFLDFLDFIGKIALQFDDIQEISVNDFLNKNFEQKKISDYFTDIIAKIGENIVLSRISCLKKDSNSEFYTYTHNPYRSNIGKICVLLKAEVKDINEDSKIFGKNICMQIAASKPMSIDIDDLDKEIIKREEEVQVATIKSSGKPENIIEKILKGKMQKFYKETTLLNQIYILDNDKIVNEVISDFSKTNFFKVLQYELFVLGS